MLLREQETPSAQLDAAQLRRTSCIPALSLLVGPPAVAVATWQGWCRTNGHTTVLAEPRQPAALADLWIEQFCQTCNLRDNVCRRLATEPDTDGGEVAATLAAKSEFERSLYTERLIAQLADPLLESVATAILDCTGEPPFAQRLRAACPRLSTTQLVGALLVLTDRAAVPGILVLLSSIGDSATSSDDDQIAQWKQQLGWLAQFAEAAPAIPLAVSLAAQSYDQIDIALPASRAATMLRRGLIKLAGVPREALAETISPAIRTGLSSTLDRLAADGITPELAQHFAEATSALAAANKTGTADSLAASTPQQRSAEESASEDDDGARSAAERFLFERLESLPQTCGLFELNQTLPIPFGRQAAMEVDLVCRQLAIAIEIDGYWHFQQADAYRRDRRKDLALQRADYLVFRCLAEDVVVRLEEILDTILGLVSLRCSNDKGHR